MAIIYLIGYMGSGKSTLGRALAGTSGARFVDLDDYIEQLTGMTVSELFAQRGESEFRRLESNALVELSKSPDTDTTLIIACGGGTPCQPGNMELMNERGMTVWLTVDQSRLIERLRADRSRRPLVARLTDEELPTFIADAMERRLPFYAKARHTFDASRLENETEISQTIAEFINRFMKP